LPSFCQDFGPGCGLHRLSGAVTSQFRDRLPSKRDDVYIGIGGIGGGGIGGGPGARRPGVIRLSLFQEHHQKLKHRF